MHEIAEKTPQQHFEGNHSVSCCKTKTNTTRMSAAITWLPSSGSIGSHPHPSTQDLLYQSSQMMQHGVESSL
jgi:hypothetical protein